MDRIQHMAEKAAKYELLQMTIKGHLKAYKEILSDAKTEMQLYREQELPVNIINLQETLIAMAKAKISALEELTK